MKKKLELRTRDDIQLVKPMIINKPPTAKERKEISEWIVRDKARNKKRSASSSEIISR